MRIIVKQGNAVGCLNHDFAVVPLKIGNVHLLAERTQRLIALVEQIGGSVVAEKGIFDNLVVQVVKRIQKLVDFINVGGNVHICVAAQFLDFFRNVVHPAGQCIGLI